jgi:hypothetical protein
MATHRMSRLHKRILRWLLADHQRTRGVTASSHEELVKALGGDKGNSSHSLHTLQARGWIGLGRTRGAGPPISISRQEGWKKLQKSARSCD